MYEVPKSGSVREVILGRPYVKIPQHTHLHVFCGFNVAMVHIRARYSHMVKICEACSHVYGNGCVWDPVKYGSGIGETVPVHCVRIKEIWSHHHSNIGEGEVKVISLVHNDQGCWKLGPEHSNVHHFIYWHIGYVPKTKHIHAPPVCHGDETIPCSQVHATNTGQVNISDSVPVKVFRALHLYLSVAKRDAQKQHHCSSGYQENEIIFHDLPLSLLSFVSSDIRAHAQGSFVSVNVLLQVNISRINVCASLVYGR